MPKDQSKHPPQPTIETQHLLLRPFRPGDAPEVQRLAGNIKVAETTMNIPHPYEDGMAEEWIATHQPGWEAHTNVVYAITLKHSGQLIGTVSLVKDKTGEWELGYWTGEPYWGRGYCTEAAKALVEFAFTQPGITKIIARHLTSNPASGRVMQKIGMRHVGRTTLSDRHGHPAEVEIYEIEKP